jgi:hypothetical protein
VLGFAILDDKLRYQTINPALVAIHGIPAAVHIGNTIRDLLGNHVAEQIDPHLERLAATGNPSIFELTATLPTRSEPGTWIANYFSIHGTAGTAIGVGVVVVEVTEQRKLDAFVHEIARDLVDKQTKDNWWIARELHASIEDYHCALGTSIGQLTGAPDKSSEFLAKEVAALDERINAMREIVALAASRFPIQS